LTETGDYWTRRRLSRRTALRGAGVATAGIASAILIGCSGDDDSPASPTAGSGGSEATPDATRNLETATATSTPTTSAIKRGGTYSTWAAGDPPTINPYDNVDPAGKVVGAFVYNRLFKRMTFPGSHGAETLPGADAALSAESEDGIVWTVKLRDLTLHDVPPVNGRQLDSEDVLFSVGLLQAVESPNRSQVEHWLNVEASDARTLIFTLDAPSPTFLDQLADANLLQLIPKEADGGFNPAVQMIGGGPWILNDYQPSVVFKFDRHPGYYEIGEDGDSIPYTDGFDYLIIPAYAERFAQFVSGNLSQLSIHSNDVISLRNLNPDLQWIGEVETLQSILYWDHLLTTDAPYRDDRFRKAVSMSLDREHLTGLGYNSPALIDAGLPANMAWNNIIPAGWGERWWLDPRSAEHGETSRFFEYDVAEAKKLLAAQGVEDGTPIPYIYTSFYTDAFPRVAEAQIEMLRAIGLDPKPDVQRFETKYFPNTFTGDFTGMAFGYETPFTEAGSYWNRLFGTDPANHSNLIVPEMTDINKRQQVEMNEDDRRAIMHEGQILNAERMYYAPSQAGAGASWRAYQPHVQGGLRDGSAHGWPTEESIWYWLDR
jgi:ABC-type transport system substrate-binding protein